MNTVFKRLTRRKDRFIKLNRCMLCVFSALAICFCGIYKAGNFFTAENLRSITLGDTAAFSLVSAKEKDYSPKNASLYKEELYLVEETEDTEENKENPQIANDQGYPIVSLDMSGGSAKGEVLIKDTDSGVKVDIASVLSEPMPSSLKNNRTATVSAGEKPLVLILHTHATECYSEEGAVSYTDDTSFRTEDTGKNMVAVGKALCDTLNAYGVSAIHCETLHDAEDYNSSYPNSLESVKYYLKKYPSIKYVFDLHRDAIIRENGELIKTECSVEGEAAAQVMALVGTNTGGADHPDWKDNLTFALKLQENLSSTHPGFARPVNLRAASFNQQYAPGSLLFEIGSCGNTLSEAKRAAVYLGEALAELILQ